MCQVPRAGCGIGGADIPFIDEQREHLHARSGEAAGELPEICIIGTREVEMADIEQVNTCGPRRRRKIEERE